MVLTVHHGDVASEAELITFIKQVIVGIYAKNVYFPKIVLPVCDCV